MADAMAVLVLGESEAIEALAVDAMEDTWRATAVPLLICSTPVRAMPSPVDTAPPMTGIKFVAAIIPLDGFSLFRTEPKVIFFADFTVRDTAAENQLIAGRTAKTW